MNIADLVTQVHEEGEEEEQQQLQPQPVQQQQNAPNNQSRPSAADEEAPAQKGCFYRIFCCCASSSSSKKNPNSQSNHPSSVPLQSAGNANHSRVDSTPSISASGVAIQNNSSLNGTGGGTNLTNNTNTRGGAQGGGDSHHSPPGFNPNSPKAGTGFNFGQNGANNNNGGNNNSAGSDMNPTTPLRDSNNIVTPPPAKYLLGPLAPEDVGKKCLVLDLDETLVHSSFKPIPNADFVISIELESVIHRVYVRKRPGVDHFMRVVGEKFEVVIFTASLSKYADPLLDILDRNRVVKARLFREACVCLAKGTPVLTADGSSVNVEELKVGSALTGEDGAVVRVTAVSEGNMDTMYRIANGADISYTVTPRHLVTLCSNQQPVVKILEDAAQKMAVVQYFEKKTLSIMQTTPRPFRLSHEPASADESPNTLVCESLQQLEVNLLREFMLQAALNPASMEAQAMWQDELFEMEAQYLYKLRNKLSDNSIVTGRLTSEVSPLLSSIQMSKVSESYAHTALDTYSVEDEDEQGEVPFSVCMESLTAKAEFASQTEHAHSPAVLLLGNGSFRPLAAGDNVGVVFVHNHSQSSAVHSIERVVMSSSSPSFSLSAASGLVSTKISSVTTILSNLNTNTVVACGASARQTWSAPSLATVAGISNISSQLSSAGIPFTSFTYSSLASTPSSLSAPRQITVYYSAQPSLHRIDTSTRLLFQSALGLLRSPVAKHLKPAFTSMDRINAPNQQYVSLEVDGNHRYALGNTLLTHNCHYGNYVKDLSHLGRRMEDILIVDNSPFSYMFQPDNAIPITSWFNDKNDRQLYELLPFLDGMLHVDNVSHVLQRKKPQYGSGIGVPPNLLPPNWQPSVQDPDVMNAQQKRGQ